MSKGIFKTFIFFIFSLLFVQIYGICQSSESNVQVFPITENSNSNFEKKESENQTIHYIDVQLCQTITNLNYKDVLYKQYSSALAQYYKDLAKKQNKVPEFYSYIPEEHDTIFSIAGRCNIPYDTIASLNQITSADVELKGKKILIPAAPGIFILDTGIINREKPETSLEALLQKKYNDKLNEDNYFCYNINGKYFFHLPEERLDPTTRAFFLDVKMKPPLDQYWLSSDYGYRKSPFNGEKQFHRGIDMAAPEGTKVYACKAGTVSSVQELDKTFGNYIVIKHVNGLSSIYAHLSRIDVKFGQLVNTGQQIGLVGKTGQVTGPHLHFEIRQNGQPTDPGAYIKR